ncbi:MAG TPA: hypothetical protein VMF64_15455 [Steroidobacteraceae bacterium]|nr:hypothetical protein [Steroidobacteraceae bacterium]
MASNAARTAGAALSGASDIAEQAGEAARRAKGKFESARQPVADKLHGAADTVRSQADRISGAAQSAADRLEASADYIKSRDAKRMMQDLIVLIKQHPTKSLLIAGAVGFLVARAFRSKD